jgi:DNA polymerase-3 subunit delta'
MTLALNLSQALNCEAAGAPCGKCDTCRKIAAGKHADVQIIGLFNGNSKDIKVKVDISVEQIEDMQHAASLPPFEGKYKVFIIDGAEQLSTGAANRLLKTLEEPAEKVIYLLLTTNDRLLLPTVVSRCQKLELPPIAAEDLETVLQERWQIEPLKAKLLSRISHGCIGWAVTISQDDTILNERTTKMENISAVLNGGIEKRFSYADQLAARFNQNRQSVQNELELWLDWWRDLLLIKVGSPDKITNVDFESELSRMTEYYTLSQIRIFVSQLQEAMVQLKLNTSPRLALEVLMLNIPGRN